MGSGGARVVSGGESGEDGSDDVMRLGGLGRIEEETCRKNNKKLRSEEKKREEAKYTYQQGNLKIYLYLTHLPHSVE